MDSTLHRCPRVFSRRLASAAVVLLAVAAFAAYGQLPQAPSPSGSPPSQFASAALPPAQMPILQPFHAASEGAAGVQPSRDQQIAAEEARILALVTELKVEVDHCNENQLLVDVVKKAEHIRKLAKGLKQELKLTFPSG